MTNILNLVAALYLSGLAAWLASYWLVGDATWWLFVINALAAYLFVPVPLVLLIAWLSRRRSLFVAGVLAVVAWAYLWGGLFLPRGGDEPTGGPSLTLMTFNTLVFNRNTDAIIGSIREADADVVFLLELSVYQAEVIRAALSGEYPYMTLDAGNASGAGVLSRIPYRTVDVPALSDPQWIGPPEVIEMELDGRAVTLVRFHALGLVRNFAVRERQARKLAAFARINGGPVIVAGDLNATPMNDSYEILTDVLSDSWREKGFGLGHTFPGASNDTMPGSSRPRAFGLSVPRWLVRIDYILHSDHWQTASVKTVSYGSSDHRPVVARLELKP